MSPMDELKKNPAFANLSPMKLLFLEQMLTEMQKQSKDTNHGWNSVCACSSCGVSVDESKGNL